MSAKWRQMSILIGKIYLKNKQISGSVPLNLYVDYLPLICSLYIMRKKWGREGGKR
jgi:hypothetical protein